MNFSIQENLEEILNQELKQTVVNDKIISIMFLKSGSISC